VSLGDLTAEESRYYALNPVQWVKHILNATPDDWQADVLQTYVDEPLVAVRSATGVGKGAQFAFLNLHFLHLGYLIPYLRGLPGATNHPPKVIVTSTDATQLSTALWPEHKLWMDRSNGLGDIFEWQATTIRHRGKNPDGSAVGNTWAAYMVTSALRRDSSGSKHSGGSQGQHRENQLIAIDEAAHVEEAYWAAYIGTLSQRFNRLFAYGNPDVLSGLFYRIWHDRDVMAQWMRYTISGRPYPVAADGKRHKHFVSARAAQGPNQETLIKTWGQKSPYVQSKVYGVHPTLALPNTSFAFEEISAARVPWRDRGRAAGLPVESSERDSVQIGCDVARSGKAETVYTIRRGWSFRQQAERHRLTDQVGDMLLDLAEEEPDSTALEWGFTPEIVIDETGVGGGVVDYVRRRARERGLKIRIRAVTFGGQARHPERYANIAAEMWCEDAKRAFDCINCGRQYEAHVAEISEAGLIITSSSVCPKYDPLAEIPDDDTLMTQAITREIKTIAPLAGKRSDIGRRALRSKEEIEQRGGESPDRMDSFCLAVVKPQKSKVL
jgi:phage terminase large subunit